MQKRNDGVKQKVKTEKRPENGGWNDLIDRAEEKLNQARQRVRQLDFLVARFRRQRDAGEPSPFDLAGPGATRR